MSYIEYLEERIPKIKVSAEKMTIDLNVSDSISFTIENIAGGFLRGKIFCEDDYINLSTNEINKNMNKIKVDIDKDSISKNTQFSTYIRVVTNGGDKDIDLQIIAPKNVFILDEFTKFYTINDVYKYSKKNIDLFCSVFVKDEFIFWLKKYSSSAFTIYNVVCEDENIFKRIDNFFILLGFKNKSYAYPSEKHINIDLMPYQKDKVVNTFRLYKSDDGYFDIELHTQEENDYFEIKTNKVTNKDFGDKDFIDIEYEIDVNKIGSTRADVVVFIGDDREHKIIITIKKVVKAKVFSNKSIYKDGEIGTISVINYLDVPVKCFAKTSSKNINFLNNETLIYDEGKFDFIVNFSSFNKGVVKFFKQPYFECEMEVMIVAGDMKIKKEINITLATNVLEIK